MKLVLIGVIVCVSMLNAVDYKEVDKRQEQMAIEVCSKIKRECLVVYSAYPYNTQELPVNNLNKIALKGKVIVIQKHDKFWGKGKNYKSKIYQNPTWLDLSILANEMIRVTGDKHHVYLEDFEIIKNKKGIQYIELQMGS